MSLTGQRGGIEAGRPDRPVKGAFAFASILRIRRAGRGSGLPRQTLRTTKAPIGPLAARFRRRGTA